MATTYEERKAQVCAAAHPPRVLTNDELRQQREKGPVAIYVGIDWRVFGRHEAIRSCGEVNDLIVWFLG